MSTSEEERELVEKAVRGDQEAFEQLIQPLLTPAMKLAYATIGDRGGAEDALQDAVLIAWRKLGNVRPDAPLRPWFLAVVARRSRQLRLTLGRTFTTDESAQTEPDAHGMDVADRVDLWRAVTRLSPRLRQLVVLRYYLDLTLADSAAIAGIPVGTAKSRLNRALEKLRLDVAAEAYGV
ncbi:MAG TPA: RNA polymerase sigma factor [Candidatus Solibacter sp.]|nr:RNA polymerase sigma factor [Candidatus Solibacter sp.]